MEDFVDINMNGGIRSNYEISFRGIVATQLKVYFMQGNEQFLRRRGDVFVKLRVLPHVFYSVDGYVPRFFTYFSVESSHQCFHFGRGIVSRVLGVVSPSFQRNVFLLSLSSQFRRFLHFVLN